jgi:(E)-4-hydroxy-3-methylbut-2-enyl-diphosphate synthase
MCNTKTVDIKGTIGQIHQLENAGCEIIRAAVPDMDSALALKEIKNNISIPLVADIHFDYKLAVKSAEYADKLRINPGNIGSEERVGTVVEAAKDYSIPIRIGVNLGSLEKNIKNKYGLTPRGMVESAKNHIKLLEKYNFYNTVVSLKASDIRTTIEACRLFSEEFDYPLHLGITEAGTAFSGAIKSAIGIGILLNEGIGNTIRISLSGDPINEIRTAVQILKHLGKRKGISVISCPTCARTDFDVNKYAELVEAELFLHSRLLEGKEKKIAIMGCVVNGPGEAEEADIAVIGAGEKDPLLYINGQYKKKIKKEDIVKTIIDALK